MWSLRGTRDVLCGALEGPEMCCVEHTDTALEGPEMCCVEHTDTALEGTRDVLCGAH